MKELTLRFLIFTTFFSPETLAQQVISYVPASSPGIFGVDPVASTIPFSTGPVPGLSTVVQQSLFPTTLQTVQPSVIQVLRQPLGGVGPFSQLVGPPAVTQVIGGQPFTPGVPQIFSGLPNIGNGVVALPYSYTTSPVTTGFTPFNGVPVVLSNGASSSLINNGPLQTLQSIPNVVQVGPVVRQVDEMEAANAALVQLDPMDAALFDMEKKGQIHMEKYAWGRVSQSQYFFKMLKRITSEVIKGISCLSIFNKKIYSR